MAARIETFRGWQLRRELLRLREGTGISMEEIAKRLDWSKAKVSRIETGRTRVTPSDVRLLLDEYGVAGEHERQVLIDLARAARKPGWWHNYPDVVASPYVSFEAEASGLRMYQTQLVTGLLQTGGYLRALLTSVRPALPPNEIDRRVEARTARQQHFLESESPHLWAILDETVLRRPVGGRDVMLEQLERLKEAARLPNVTLQILPFSAGSHAAMGVPFVIMDFDGPAPISAVYLEHLTGELFLEGESDLSRYTLVFDYLRAKASDPEDVVPVIEEIAART
ncbi:transcriptional regulator [Actinomadura craniellae]|uniref:Transcriptional regulator n=1 Tax=Actinomadura craniellae TaxID=2231787 RepID=A0A365H7L2_9ACTN|nr:helix-turn-helix transcriptional regulator [Actinomadura craniellae]RAY15008.1 transcriptional regulator [Actinomadura craniellae]